MNKKEVEYPSEIDVLCGTPVYLLVEYPPGLPPVREISVPRTDSFNYCIFLVETVSPMLPLFHELASLVITTGAGDPRVTYRASREQARSDIYIYLTRIDQYMNSNSGPTELR